MAGDEVDNVYISKDSKRSTHRIFSNNFLKILQRLPIKYFSKTVFDGYFKLTKDVSLKSVA